MKETTKKKQPKFKFRKCNKCYCRRKYLNEFQLCDFCYNQIKRVTPSGFKPNFKPEECRRCNQKKDYLNEFNECSSCEKCKRCKNQRRDYLNKFQFCNLCCKDMERVTPSGFKPNFKLEECRRCNQKKDCLNEFLICNSCHEQLTFISSENEIIDDFMRNTLWKMEFVSYNNFKNLEFIAEGGFSKIYKATWINGPITKWNEDIKNYDRVDKKVVVLKELNNSKGMNSKMLNELKIYYNLVLKENNISINTYYGITKDPITKNLMIIMDYHESGDLTHYLTYDFFNISWYDKLHKLLGIINGLKNIHNADIIHEDYHSGNIFIGYFVITGDLGLSKSAIDNDDDEIYGVIPYVASEIFQGQKYTKASDIYGLGMIMWELMTGRRPFWDQSHDADLIIKICDGFRPPIVSNAPKGYIEIMKQCWHPDPERRPIASELYDKIVNIHIAESKDMYKNPTQIIKSPDIGPIANNPCAIYKSRPLSTMIKSAEFAGYLSKKVTSESDSLYNNNYKRKFYENEDNSDNDKITKRTKQSGNDDYVTTELEMDIDFGVSNSTNSTNSNKK